MKVYLKAQPPKKPTKPKIARSPRPKAKPLTPPEQAVSAHAAETFGALGAAVNDPKVQAAIEAGAVNAATDAFPWGVFDQKINALAGPLEELVRRSLVIPHLMPKAVVIGTNFNHLDPRVALAARTQASKLAASMAKEQYAKVRTIIGNGVAKGDTSRQIARQLRAHIGLNSRQDRQMATARLDATQAAIDAGLTGDAIDASVTAQTDSLWTKMINYRADMIARTETMAAQNQGLMLGIQQSYEDPQSSVDNTYLKRWIATDDERTCESCGAVDGTEVPLDENFVLDDGTEIGYPLEDGSSPHPQCFPAGTLIAGPAVTGSMSRWFEGKIVQLLTREGTLLTATPNHPILTDQGWVALGLLNEGARIVRGPDFQRPVSVNLDDKQDPARIENIVESFSRASGVFTVEVPVTAPDFHGDGAGSQVAVVNTNLPLRDNLTSRLAQPVSENFLGATPEGSFPLDRGSMGQLGLDALGNPTDGVVGEDGIGHVLLGSAPSVGHAVCFCLLSEDNPCVCKDSIDGGSSASETMRERIHRLAPEISLDDLALCDLDIVTAVSTSNFAGHVYNLETVDGWYIANGIIVHNCRCTVGLVPPDRSVSDLIDQSAQDSADASQMAMDFTAALAPSQAVIDQALQLFLKEFNPDQPRDDHGMWTSDGGGGSDTKVALSGRSFTGAQEEQARAFTQKAQVFNPPLTQDQMAAVAQYQSDYFEIVNPLLRSGATPSPNIAVDIHNTDAAIAASSFKEGFIAYRGLGDDTGQFAALKVGDTFTDKAYSSTSLNPMISEVFAAQPSMFGEGAPPTMLQIQVPAGYPAIASDLISEKLFGPDISRISDQVVVDVTGATRMNEITLPRNTTYEVLGHSVSSEGTPVIQVRPVR